MIPLFSSLGQRNRCINNILICIEAITDILHKPPFFTQLSHALLINLCSGIQLNWDQVSDNQYKELGQWHLHIKHFNNP
jgi:hypothetical protein